MTAPTPVHERYAEYEHWLVLNPADQIVEVGQLLAQRVRALEYLTSPFGESLSAFEPDLSGIQPNG